MIDNKKYEIYLEVKHDLLVEDARNFIIDYLIDKYDCYADELDIDWDKYDLEYLVSQFEDREDGDISFNETWRNIVADYIDDIEED